MKPSPKHVETVCSVCGLEWSRHKKKTAEECVELLKADLAKEKLRTAPIQPAIPHPYPVPYPTPYPVSPYRPYRNPWPYPNWQQPGWTTTSGTNNYQGSAISLTKFQ